MDVTEKPLTVNPYSRPGKQLLAPEFVAMHWVEKPHMTALGVWDFWESRKAGTQGFGGGHYVVDDRGALCCVPESEMEPHVGTGNGITAWATERIGGGKHLGYSKTNYHCLAVEMCNLDTEGAYSEVTYRNAVEIVADICTRHHRDPFRHVITHYQVVGWKKCPRWFVTKPGELDRFRWEVASQM